MEWQHSKYFLRGSIVSVLEYLAEVSDPKGLAALGPSELAVMGDFHHSKSSLNH
jgi:hypothetical protein